MANQQEGLLTTDQLEQILRVLVAEIRKPPVDPIKEIQKEREKKTKEASLASMWANKFRKRDHCKHEREDGTCVVAWATQSDGTERGYCPNCDWVFTPADGELYAKVRSMTRGRKDNVRYVS